jgi:hypothetical protein
MMAPSEMAQSERAAAPVLPYTGKEFLDSLDDGREVWIYGERVKNIEHPAFRNTARMIARLYDALHQDRKEEKGVLTAPTEWGGFAHRYFMAPRSAEDLVAGRDAIAAWARLTYGWLGRSPDYEAAFLATLGANAEFYAPYDANARHWYRYSQERVPYVNHAIVHPPVDRNMAPGAPGGPTDIYAHVTRETDAGMHPCDRRQGRRHRLGIDAFHLCRACRADPDPGQECRARLPGPDQRARRQVHLPRLERAARRGARQPVRLPAVEPPRRERRDLHHG